MSMESEAIADRYTPAANTLGRWIAAALMCVVLVMLAGCNRRPTTNDPLPQPDVVEAIYAQLHSSGGAAGSQAAPVSQGTGWATLTGTFSYQGDSPPARQPLNVNKERNVCAPSGMNPLDQVLMVNPANQGIANIVLVLRNKRPRVHESVAATTGQVVFDQKQCIFLTHVFAMQLGQTLVVKNSDPIGHNTNISGANPFNQIISANSAVEFTPLREERAPAVVTCNIHPWMKAYFLTRENSYFAVTDENGKFTIENLPAGDELEFQVWHEDGAGTNNGLPAESSGLKWSDRGRFKLTLVENETKDLAVTVPVSSFLRK